ncbi:MAG: D-amino acid aminotransferase [Phycisphaerales bacterium]|nr:MAG: D-amino acid aminotransferase [Phycisphaerales bacterium]
MPDIAFCAGRFVPLEEALVPVNDRAVQFGDSVYEVVAAYSGTPFLLERHLERLQRSLTAVAIDFDPQAASLSDIIADGLERCGYDEAMVYIQITRGVAPRAHVPPPGIQPNVIVTFRRLPIPPEAVRTHGIRVMTTPDIRWAKCSVKATTLLANVLAGMEARRRGYYDAIFVGDDDDVREGTHANIVAVRGGGLHFPTRDASILHGVTLQFLIECAAGLGIGVTEGPLSVAELLSADEAFLCNTISEVLPIVAVNEQTLADGLVGQITARMMAEFRHQSRAWAARAAVRNLSRQENPRACA